MDISNYKQTEEFKTAHKECQLKTSLTDDNKDTVIISCQKHHEAIMTYIPYRMFCLHIDKCAGRGSCPRSYACCE